MDTNYLPYKFPLEFKNKKESVLIRKAVSDDAAPIHDTMQKVFNSLSDKSLFVCDELDYVKNTIEENGFALVACNQENQIVASFLFRYPKTAKDNLGRDIGMSDEDLSKVVHMDSVVVLPEYRGHGLHSKMLSLAEGLIDHTQYNCFLATVSPDNPASFRSFEKCGYILVTTKEKYGGFMRRIYQKKV